MKDIINIDPNYKKKIEKFGESYHIRFMSENYNYVKSFIYARNHMWETLIDENISSIKFKNKGYTNLKMSVLNENFETTCDVLKEELIKTYFFTNISIL